MRERARTGEVEVSINLPPSDEIMTKLRERNLLIPGDPAGVCITFATSVGGKQLTPREIAISWANAREGVMGPGSSLRKFFIGLDGRRVINTIIEDKKIAKQARSHLSQAFSDVKTQK